MISKSLRPVGAASAAAPTRSGRRRRNSLSDGWWPVLFVLPLFAGVILFYLYPIVQTAVFSFTTGGVFGGSTFTGLDNYTRLLSDPQLGRSLLNTLIYTAIVVGGVPIAIGLSVLMNRPKLRFLALYRVIYLLPYIAMPVAVAMVWRIMLKGDFGVVNWFLSLFGIRGPSWLATEWLAIVSVSVVGLWIAIGFDIIILSAGLKSIPPELYEAARLDGASRWQQFIRITIPLLTPSIFFVLVITVIGGFKLFDLLYVLLGTLNPALAKSQSLVYFFYEEAFVAGDKGYGAAIAILILVIIAVFTAFQFRLQRRWVFYD